MNPRKLLLATITAMLMAAAIGQHATAQTLQVHHANGATTDLVLGTGTTVKFQDDHVLLSSPSQTCDFAKADVLRFTYTIMRADVNGDGAVDVADIATVISVMASSDVGAGVEGDLQSPVPARKEADVNGDGTVDVADIATIIATMAEMARRAQSREWNAGKRSPLRQDEAATVSGTIGEAFYIYRNDGQFNAFFRDEIDSIGFSRYDQDSLRYNKIASQVVYTPDSTYMIPLTAIDSVGFVQPETIVSDDVFPLTADHSLYISDADTLKFTMSASTPEALRPKVGNIVVATADCDAFPHGIIARVESVMPVGNGLLYECSKAYIEDVFEQLVVYTNGRIGEGDLTRRDGMRRITHTETLWDEQWTSTITGGGTSTTLNVGDRATATVTVCKTLTTPFFFQLQLQNALTTSVDFTAESTASIYKELQIGKTITAGKIPIAPNITFGLLWLEPKLSLYGYFEEKGKVELKYGGHFNRTDLLSFTYTQRSWTFAHTPATDAGTDVAQLSMEGSAEIGLKPQIDFSINGQQAGFGLNARLGLKESINFVFDATHLKDGGLYDAMRDSYCRTTIPWSINVHANANIFSRYDGSQSEEGFATFSHTFKPAKEPQWGEDRYIFPLFAGVEGKRQGEKVTAKAGVSRTPLLPVQVGFSLIDKDKNIVQTKYDGRSYRAGNIFSSYSCELSGLDGSEKYTVRPSVKLFGQDVLASPEAEVKDGETSCPDENHPHAIDLGLPSGTLWACCNVGASTPEGYGNYYAWGETSPKSVYNLDTYQYYYNNSDLHSERWIIIGSEDEFNWVGVDLRDIAGTGYDATTVNWGTPWRMPSWSQIQELLDYTYSDWTTQNGVNGLKFTGYNGSAVFLPAAGYRWDEYLYAAGSGGRYWSSSLMEYYPDEAYGLYFGSGYTYLELHFTYDDRSYGYSVRPVR